MHLMINVFKVLKFARLQFENKNNLLQDVTFHTESKYINSVWRYSKG